MLLSQGISKHARLVGVEGRKNSLSSTRATLGQNFFSFSHPSGYAAFSRVYGLSHLAPASPSPLIISAMGCGAILSTLPTLGAFPSSTSRISCRMLTSASTNRSSSSLDSDSVGSIMSVLATGQLMVGAWKP